MIVRHLTKEPKKEGLSFPTAVRPFSLRHAHQVFAHLEKKPPEQNPFFNGEIGTVCEVDREAGRLCVEYDGRLVDYDEGDIEELALAYAISVHKSQGSEYPVVILPLVTQHYIMLQRNLLYTALTRAQHMVIMVGNPKAVRIAVEADQPRQRRSLLAWWMMNGINQEESS